MKTGNAVKKQKSLAAMVNELAHEAFEQGPFVRGEASTNQANRVEALRRQISSGKYAVSSRVVARALLNLEENS